MLTIYYLVVAIIISSLSLKEPSYLIPQIGEDIVDLWQQHPNRIRSLVAALDLNYPGLDQVKDHLTRNDTLQACSALLQYYGNQHRNWLAEAIDPLSYEEALPVAQRFAADSVLIHGVPDKIPLDAHGGWQWNYLGPDNDAEFAYSLNAMSYLPALLVTYQRDRNDILVEVYNRILKDWVIKHPLPQPLDSIYLVLNQIGDLDYRDIGEVEWRTLDTGRRLGASWPQTFFAFYHHDKFEGSTKLLMLSSLVEQANYLRKYHKSGHNWTTMEMNGLALTGLAFPEFREAKDWADYALQTMTEEINRQVYPDGVQVEISTKTQWVALRRFESLARNFASAGRNPGETFAQRVEDMYHYLAYSLRPDGHQPINNDSDREDLRPRLQVAADKYGRPDWTYICTNGSVGEMPPYGPSVTFPWAGIEVMRNGWGKNADWAFFDHGPYGTGHQHRDMLHLSISAFGQDLLVDGGRYTHRDYFSFDPTVWRGYFRSSLSHNVILVDGQGQKEGLLKATQPLEEGKDYIHHPDFDFATGMFSSGFENLSGKIEHRRSVVYLKNHQWLVVDFLRPDSTRDISALWHFSPRCEVVIDDHEAVTMNANMANLRIIPLGDINWNATIVEGQETPVIQGWYSADYNVKVPNPTMIYQTTISHPVTFAWLMIADSDEVERLDPIYEINDDFIHLSYHVEGKPIQIHFPLSHEGKLISIQK
jgi:hypothetical protein